MKYKINAFLIYDVTEGALKLDDEGASDTHLTITANALLYFMIRNPGVISRDCVMQRVWDDNGLVSSNSNLNQYLSMLRKVFRCYGIDNVIVTVARGRLELNPELTIELIDDSRLMPSEAAATDDAACVTPARAGDSGGKLYWLLAGFAITLLAVTLCGWCWLNGSGLATLPLTLLAQTPAEVFTTDAMIDTRIRHNYLNNFTTVINKINLKPDRNDTFVFFYGDKLQSAGLGRTFLVRCTRYAANQYRYCDNYFYYSWK